MDNSICFIITSVIEPWTALPFNYSRKRSAFSPEERFSQTCETIASIHKYAPHADIWLLEGGKPNYTTKIMDLGVRILNVSNSRYVKRAVMSNSKAWGEASMMLYALPYMLIGKYKSYFKISGRYCLNEHFDMDRWSTTNISGKDIYGDKNELSTRLFCIPKCQLFHFYKALLSRWWKLKGSGTVYENYLSRHIGHENISWISPIGVEGKIGVNGKEVKE